MSVALYQPEAFAESLGEVIVKDWREWQLRVADRVRDRDLALEAKIRQQLAFENPNKSWEDEVNFWLHLGAFVASLFGCVQFVINNTTRHETEDKIEKQRFHQVDGWKHEPKHIDAYPYPTN